MSAYILVIIIVFILIAICLRRYNTTVYDKIYLDNNGTTQPHKEVVKEMYDTAYLGNASTSYAWDAKLKIEELQTKISEWLSDDLDFPKKVVITSGASESNNFVIRGCVDAFGGQKLGQKPTIILSEIEHKTSLECAKQLVKEGRANVVLVKPEMDGIISPQSVREAIQKSDNVVLVSIMAANNETGAVNDIESIGTICKNARVPFHTDAVQIFGKSPIPMYEWGISALSMSFHKMNGPMGIGALVLSEEFAKQLPAQIAGSQNDGLRGGTQNVPAIAGAGVAMDITLNDRKSKNAHLRKMKNLFLSEVSDSFDLLFYSQFAGKTDEGAIDMLKAQPKHSKKGLVVIGPIDSDGYPIDEKTLPNTLMVSVLNLPTMEKVNDYKPFCNMKLKSNLAADDVIVSIGSACNTSEKGASHVIKAMGAPFIIRCGVVRISLGDYNTESQVRQFAKKFIKACYLQ